MACRYDKLKPFGLAILGCTENGSMAAIQCTFRHTGIQVTMQVHQDTVMAHQQETSALSHVGPFSGKEGEVRHCSIFVFTETWLRVLDAAIDLVQLISLHGDRNTALCDKTHVMACVFTSAWNGVRTLC